MIGMIIDLIKTGVGFFQKKEQSKQELDAQNSHEQNQITLEETRKGFTWRQGLGWVLTFIILWNYVIVPVLALCGVVLPIVPLDEIWKVLIILIGGS
ncbi:hypothetical protein HRZ08_004598 [Escherichia coli]|jgi:ABC-type uncharacterized transport system involved in gliding motility auxiliary subunit|uniref:hypothetical protein n=1 Tax=Enterobacteriaceae TaxID=543 RepID=UPI0002610D72|nr:MULTISPECIES: hypothetical protein [Enterobacteriaceae]RDA98608.1 hypothetical protein DVB85_19810 [Klebsiella oxytoca]ASO78953.1 hypothetical protein AKN40_2157 [Escherichia coli]EAB7362160.1 hypothetical protein [Escherichia coli]EAC0859331.1 hypothetical protein [Escherichia coli]EEV6099815.1 hypothetical protein [Escherichia coli]